MENTSIWWHLGWAIGAGVTTLIVFYIITRIGIGFSNIWKGYMED